MILRCVLIVFGIAMMAMAKRHLSEPKSEILDSDSKYLLTWQVNLDEERIYFEVMVETTGFVGLGISSGGKMNKADIFFGGITNEVPYFVDMHGVEHALVEDNHADWNLVSGSENSTHTHLKFWRLLNTCDDQDFPITNDTTRLIWSYGTMDKPGYHGSNRGTKSFNFLVPEEPEWNPSKYRRFDVTTNLTMPKKQTTYWCTVHRGPKIASKNHIVSFEAFLDNANALKHTHHFVLTMCNAPAGMNATELFDHHVGTNGDECYLPENQTLPFQYCREYLYVWAVGGKPSRFPENVGYPFGESDQNIYYMLEVHYDNPTNIEGLAFKTGLTIYHTDELREMDAGLMWTPHDVNPSLIIPPNTPDFVISTHCAPTCTNKFPSGGITIFNVMLHSHLAGRKMNFRHFRNGTELPWILKDGNYDFNFQQGVLLREPVKILPGDQMTVECVFDSTDRNNTVISGGYSTREEMCETIFWYYPKISLSSCGSVYPLHTALTEYGVTNYTLIPVSTEIDMPWIWSPKSLAGTNGMDFITFLNTRYNWTQEYIDHMRVSRQYGKHEFRCDINGEDPITGNVQYPEIDKKYAPPNQCQLNNLGYKQNVL